MLEICGMATVAEHEPAYSDDNSQGSPDKPECLKSAWKTLDILSKTDSFLTLICQYKKIQ